MREEVGYSHDIVSKKVLYKETYFSNRILRTATILQHPVVDNIVMLTIAVVRAGLSESRKAAALPSMKCRLD